MNIFRSHWSYWDEINMPFHQRSVEPRRVSRLTPRDGWLPREETGRRKLRKPVLFSSLDEVSCQTLTNIIYQLSDLSRHASDIFLGIEMEAGIVFRRSCRIQGRLQILQDEVGKLDPKKIKIRKFAALVMMLVDTMQCESINCDTEDMSVNTQKSSFCPLQQYYFIKSYELLETCKTPILVIYILYIHCLYIVARPVTTVKQ